MAGGRPVNDHVQGAIMPFCRAMFFLCLCVLCFAISSAYAEDWPQWRGPNRDGVWRESGIVDHFDSDRLEPVWRAPLGSGYSGPTVAAGRVYVTDRVVE